MIKFTCHCTHVFEFPDDMAGKQAQCPDCQRLVDVPTMNELAQLSEDGTFLLNAAVQPRSGEFEQMRRVYAKDKVDENGEDVDLRQTLQELAAAGTEDNILEFEERPTNPKYDPETGELIRPLDIVQNPDFAHPSQIPMATRTLNYANAELDGDSLYSPVVRLLSPINLAAMFFVLLAHVFFFFTAFSGFLSIAAIIFVGPALIAHYANVVEEIGIEEHDELPRFLRNFNLIEDIWHPFAHVFLAWMICFGPAIILWLFWVFHGWPLTGGVVSFIVLDAIGLILFPAVVLTTITSGSLLNLRPDRILSVIAQIGPRYALLVILYAVALVFYILGMFDVPIEAYLLAAIGYFQRSGGVWAAHRGNFPDALFRVAAGIILSYPSPEISVGLPPARTIDPGRERAAL
jgi:hypothetical protein